MKRTTAMALALLLMSGLLGCAPKESDAPGPVDNGPELTTIDVLVCQRSYKADGTKGTYMIEYTYDTAGRLLTEEHDRGEEVEYWDKELGVLAYRSLPYDGTIDTLIQYGHDERGSLTSYTVTIDGDPQDAAAPGLTFDYDDQGHPQQLRYDVIATGEKRTRSYRYDDQGHLIQVDEGADCLTDIAYDEAGQLTCVCYHYPEQIRRVCYAYDQEGRLSEMRSSTAPGGVQHSDGIEFQLESTVEFAYDKNGDLASRKTYGADGYLLCAVICSYLEPGKLDSICYFASDGNLEDSFRYTYENGQTKCVWSHSGGDAEATYLELLYDEDGDLLRRTEDNGDYIEYEYRTLQVTPEEAELFRRTSALRTGVGQDGTIGPQGFGYLPLSSHYLLISYPTTPLHPTDALRAWPDPYQR